MLKNNQKPSQKMGVRKETVISQCFFLLADSVNYGTNIYESNIETLIYVVPIILRKVQNFKEQKITLKLNKTVICI